MKLYLISQNVNNDWDTYDSAVVAAEDELQAAKICPDKYYIWENGCWNFVYSSGEKKAETPRSWCEPTDINVVYLGEASKDIESGVILSSFNAG